MIVLDERFDFIGKYNGIMIYDTKHAIQEFRIHYPHLSLTDYKRILKDGVEEIVSEYDTALDNYMIQSISLKVKIPIEIRPDRNTREISGYVPTTLGEHEIINLRNEIVIFVENNKKNMYKRFPLIEGFNCYIQEGKMFEDFSTITVD